MLCQLQLSQHHAALDPFIGYHINTRVLSDFLPSFPPWAVGDDGGQFLVLQTSLGTIGPVFLQHRVQHLYPIGWE